MHYRKLARFLSLITTLLTITYQANANLVSNGSFESVTPPTTTNEICATFAGPYPICSATGWTGNYQIGNGATIGIFGSSFGIPQPDPNGTQALILQENNTATQTGILFPTTGNYTLSFYIANRSDTNTGPQTVTVLLDGSSIPNGVFGGLPADWTFESLNFSATAGSNSITFEGLQQTTNDVSAFIDYVSIVPEGTTVPEPSYTWMACSLGVVLLMKRMRLTTLIKGKLIR